MAVQFYDNIKINAGKPADSKYLSPLNQPYTGLTQVIDLIPIGERHVGLTMNIENDEYWFEGGVFDSDLKLKMSASGSTVNSVFNIGDGVGVFSGITIGGAINLRSILGSGNTSVSLSGDTVIINSVDTTALQSSLLFFDSGEETYKPYSSFTTGVTFYYGGASYPTGTTRLNLNSRLAVTELTLSTTHESTGTTHISGDLYWDSYDETITLQQTNDVKQQIGQELFIRAKNDTAGSIPNGSIVYISGTNGDRPIIELARASENDSLIVGDVIGITTHDIPSGEVGFITTYGVVRDLNTTGFAEGDAVYLSTTVWGGLTNVKPTYPDYTIEIGIVTKSDATDGQILIRINNISTARNNIRGVEMGGDGTTATTRSDIVVGVESGTYYLPDGPTVGQQITFIDLNGDAQNNVITINGNGNPINSNSDDSPPNYLAYINTNFGSMSFVYIGGTTPNYGWRVITNTA